MDIGWHDNIETECENLCAASRTAQYQIGHIIVMIQKFAERGSVTIDTACSKRLGKASIYWWPGKNFNAFFSMDANTLYVGLIAETANLHTHNIAYLSACDRCDQYFGCP